MKSVHPSLWFNGVALEAAEFYVNLFGDAEIYSVSHYPDGVPVMGGKVLTVAFRLREQDFVAINAGPEFSFTEAVSFVVQTKDQAETDHFWDAFTADGGEESQCGWCKDKYGLSWQVVPTRFLELMSTDAAGRVSQAMMQMKKFDIAALEAAAAGE